MVPVQVCRHMGNKATNEDVNSAVTMVCTAPPPFPIAHHPCTTSPNPHVVLPRYALCAGCQVINGMSARAAWEACNMHSTSSLSPPRIVCRSNRSTVFGAAMRRSSTSTPPQNHSVRAPTPAQCTHIARIHACTHVDTHACIHFTRPLPSMQPA